MYVNPEYWNDGIMGRMDIVTRYNLEIPQYSSIPYLIIFIVY
jgi:hypothetical protein